MGDELREEAELVCLQSMGERVERLRSRLKELKKDSYSVTGITEEQQRNTANQADGVSQEIHMTEK